MTAIGRGGSGGSILKAQAQQLGLDIGVMSLPAVVSPSGCWGLVCLQRMQGLSQCVCVCPVWESVCAGSRVM